MLFFKPKRIDYENLIQTLEKGDDTELMNLLWMDDNVSINYLPATLGMLKQFKNNNSAKSQLTIHKTIKKKGFELIIFNTPNFNEEVPYNPLIVEIKSGKIVGRLLPFNELHGYMAEKHNNIIRKLSGEWLKFYIPLQFTK